MLEMSQQTRGEPQVCGNRHAVKEKRDANEELQHKKGKGDETITTEVKWGLVKIVNIHLKS